MRSGVLRCFCRTACLPTQGIVGSGFGGGDMAGQPDRIDRIGLRAPYGGPVSAFLSWLGVRKYAFLVRLLSKPAYLGGLRGLMGLARRFTPVVRTGPVSWTLSHAHNVALLEQSDDFLVTAGLSDRLPAGPFLMDIDWAGQHKAEKKVVEFGLGSEGGAEVMALRAFAGDRCARYIAQAGDMPLNVARDFTEELTLDVVHRYFGIGDNQLETRRRLRSIFRLLASQIFQSAPVGGERALATLKAQDDLLDITLRTQPRPNTVLQRLSPMPPWLIADWRTTEWAARNTAALAAFGSGTVARAGTQTVYRLLTLKGAEGLAWKAVRRYRETRTEDDRARVLQIALEALRFNPMLPLMGVRHAARRSELYAHCPHARVRADPGEVFIPSPFAAMFDAAAFPHPTRFRTDERRIGDYLHFGHGRHICVGKHIAEALLEEIVISLFSQTSIEPVSRQITYDGPAVETYEVRLNA